MRHDELPSGADCDRTVKMTCQEDCDNDGVPNCDDDDDDGDASQTNAMLIPAVQPGQTATRTVLLMNAKPTATLMVSLMPAMRMMTTMTPIPDECDADSCGELFGDCDGNGVADFCEPDCDGDNVIDACDEDDDNDGIPDNCDADSCGQTFTDCDNNGVADFCQTDCDNDGAIDACDDDDEQRRCGRWV